MRKFFYSGYGKPLRAENAVFADFTPSRSTTANDRPLSDLAPGLPSGAKATFCFSFHVRLPVQPLGPTDGRPERSAGTPSGRQPTKMAQRKRLRSRRSWRPGPCHDTINTVSGQRSDKTKTALIIGATSGIGRAVARKLADEGWALQLAARDPERLDREVRDLCLRTDAAIAAHLCDVLQEDGGAAMLDDLDPLPDIAVCTVGTLGDQAESERRGSAAACVMRTNYVGPALLMGALAESFAQRGSGVLVGISSVAGDRGRGSNYVYGSAKAGFSAFLSGLRSRLTASGVHVVTIKPGFVRTRMTDGMDLPTMLTAEPEEVADAVVGAVRRRRDIVYVRRIWRPIMAMIRALPERVFKKTKL